MYWLAYAVARYSRAFMRSGSSSFASLKFSTARSNCASLKAATPLFSRSRARSLLQPGTPAARINIATTANARLGVREKRELFSRDTFSSVIEASIPDQRGRFPAAARIHFRSLPPLQLVRSLPLYSWRSPLCETSRRFASRGCNGAGAIPSRSAIFFQFRTQQADGCGARRVHEVQNLGNRLKFERTICLEKRDPVRTSHENFLEPRAQFPGPYC